MNTLATSTLGHELLGHKLLDHSLGVLHPKMVLEGGASSSLLVLPFAITHSLHDMWHEGGASLLGIKVIEVDRCDLLWKPAKAGPI